MEKKITKKENNLKENSAPKKPKILFRIIMWFLVFFAGVCFAIYCTYSIQKILTNKKYIKTVNLIDNRIVKCAELSTVKSYYSEIVSVKKLGFMGLAKSYSIVKYSGIVRAGIKDLSLVQTELSKDSKELSIILPKAEILGNEIRSFEVFDEHKSMFISLNTNDILTEIEKSQDIVTQNLIDEGILKDAEEYACRVLKNFFSTMEFDKVTVIVEDDKLPSISTSNLDQSTE